MEFSSLLKMRLYRDSSLSPVFYKVHTQNLAYLNKNGLCRVPTLAEDGFTDKKHNGKEHPGLRRQN